ncbi:hypothetical protein C478_14212 [Natrinema thermotolerans DSM 11552]|nr:hypothetical protein C478_14212 [Natrinema thermotolerans DSM 11552]
MPTLNLRPSNREPIASYIERDNRGYKPPSRTLSQSPSEPRVIGRRSSAAFASRIWRRDRVRQSE